MITSFLFFIEKLPCVYETTYSILNLCFLVACKSRITEVEYELSIEEALSPLSYIDMQDLANRTIAIKNPTSDKLISILTEDELTVFQNVGTNLNKASRFHNEYQRNLNMVLIDHKEIFGCNTSNLLASQEADDDCTLECSAYFVSLTGALISVTGGFIALGIALVSYGLAAESVYDCFGRTGTTDCIGTPAPE